VTVSQFRAKEILHAIFDALSDDQRRLGRFARSPKQSMQEPSFKSCAPGDVRSHPAPSRHPRQFGPPRSPSRPPGGRPHTDAPGAWHFSSSIPGIVLMRTAWSPGAPEAQHVRRIETTRES